MSMLRGIVVGLSQEGFKEFQKFNKANRVKSKDECYEQVEKVEDNARKGRDLTHGFYIDAGDGKLEVVGESLYTYSNLNNLETYRLQTLVLFRLAVERRSVDELIAEFSSKKLSPEYTSWENFQAFVEALKENDHMDRKAIRDVREDKQHLEEDKLND